MINLDKLGELGQSIKDFDYKTFREENREFLQEIYGLYDVAVRDNLFDNKEDFNTALLVQSKINEILNDEEFFEFLVNKRLDSVVDRILKSIYALDGFNHINTDGLQERLSDEKHVIPVLSAKDKKTKSAPIADELSSIKMDDLRSCLFETVGFSFTPIKELKNMREHAVTLEQRSIVKEIWERNGFDNYYIVALVFKTDRDPLFDESFYREEKKDFVDFYRGNISKFAINSKKLNLQS